MSKILLSPNHCCLILTLFCIYNSLPYCVSLSYEMTKYKMDEFCIPRSYILRMEKTTKRAWEENISEQTDNRTFYPEFYKFALLLKTLGFFPVQVTKLSSDLNFSWASVTTVFSVLTLPVVQIVTVNLCPLKLLKQFFAYTSVIVPIYTNVIYISKLPSFIKLIQLMDSIDTNYCLKPGDAKETRKNNNFVIGFFLFSALIVGFPFQFLMIGFQPETLNFYICKIHRSFVMCMVTCLVYVVCYQLIELYNRYHSSLAALEERPCDEVYEQLVEDHRLIHAQLVRCVRLLDRSFGFWLMVTYVTNSIQFIKTCYSVMYGESPLTSAVHVIIVSYTLFFIFYPAVLTDRIYNKSKDTIHFTFRMALKPYSEDVLFQVYYFMRQVKINVASVSAGGLADVNKEIITKALSLFATFYIATIQLAPQMELLMDSFREWLIQIDGKQDMMNTTLETFPISEKS